MSRAVMMKLGTQLTRVFSHCYDRLRSAYFNLVAKQHIKYKMTPQEKLSVQLEKKR